MPCINTFAYDWSAYLADNLSPSTGKSQFVSTISNETTPDNDIRASFAVESLFTNIPIDTGVQPALQKLENDPSLANRTTMTPAQIAELSTFVLRSTYFQYNGSIYEQKDGATMGSPVSSVIANLYRESFEEQAMITSSDRPRIWKHYNKKQYWVGQISSICIRVLLHLENIGFIRVFLIFSAPLCPYSNIATCVTIAPHTS